jgi:hypothetical protein
VVTGVVVSLLTKPEPKGLVDAFYLCLKTPIGQEHVLREAGFVERPGGGTFDLPPDVESRQDLASYVARIDRRQVRKEAIYGFVAITAVMLGLLGSVILLARWLGGG